VPEIGLLDLLAGTEGQGGSLSETEHAELQRHWRGALQQAGAVARRVGRGFGRTGLDAVRDIQDATSPNLGWRELLWQFMVATPFDFGGFDRRFIHRKLYLEDVVGESVQVAVCVDTSGSVGGAELGAFLAEVRGILDAYTQIRGQLFYADADLYGPYEFSAGDAIPAAKGGGGTSFVPFFDWIHRQEQQGTQLLAIYLTDGFGDFPKQAPDSPVMWVVSAGGLESVAFPFGHVVRMAR
jgi:predicted metal-dependent peptidase